MGAVYLKDVDEALTLNVLGANPKANSSKIIISPSPHKEILCKRYFT